MTNWCDCTSRHRPEGRMRRADFAAGVHADLLNYGLTVEAFRDLYNQC